MYASNDAFSSRACPFSSTLTSYFAPNSTGVFAFPRTIGRTNGWAMLTIRSATLCFFSSNIRFPQDFSLLNEARAKLDGMIDKLHSMVEEPRRPRTYRKVLRKAYLAMAKAKKRPAKKMRSLVRVMLCAVKRNMDFVDAYLAKGLVLEDERDVWNLDTIRKLYAQQKEMFDGEQVASSIIVPRFPFADGFPSFSSACSGVGLAPLTTTSLILLMKSIPKRLRSSGRMPCPNGHFVWQLSSPMKYW